MLKTSSPKMGSCNKRIQTGIITQRDKYFIANTKCACVLIHFFNAFSVDTICADMTRILVKGVQNMKKANT